MHRPLAVLSLAALAFILPGCIIVATDRHYQRATPKELEEARQVEPGHSPPSIRSNYRDQLAKLSPGDSISAFRADVPSAVFVEQKNFDGHKIDAYSLKLDEPYHMRGDPFLLTAHDEAWFYFRDGQFVKWGEPNQWP